jgi:hypothetical protein
MAAHAATWNGEHNDRDPERPGARIPDCGGDGASRVSGIGRATLYKYFPDVEAVLVAWHERQVAQHLDQLAKARDQAGDEGPA